MESADFQTQVATLKPVYRTLIYYAIVLPATILFNTLPGFKTGPCTPNFDLLSIAIMFFGAIVLLIVNLVRLKRNGRDYLPSVIIHFFVLIGYALYGIIS